MTYCAFFFEVSSRRKALGPDLHIEGKFDMAARVRAALTALGIVGASAAYAQAPGAIQAIGIENEYADAIAQVGGKGAARGGSPTRRFSAPSA